MIYKSCGKEISDDAIFCANCGAKVAADDIKENEPAAQPVPVQQAAPIFATPEGTLSKEQIVNIAANAQKKNNTKMSGGAFFKKFGFIFIIVGVLVILAGVFVANYKYIVNAIMKAGNSDTYFKWVAKNYAEKQTDDAISLYNDYKEICDLSDEKYTGNLELELGDEADKFLKLAKGAGYDYTWVDTAGLTVEVNSKEEMVNCNLGLSFNGVQVSEIDTIIDLKDETDYIGFPSVDSAYGYQESYEAEDIDEYIEEISVLYSALPDSSDVKKLIMKYIVTALDQVKSGDVKVGKDTLRAGGITQELTAVKLTIDNDLCQRVALSVVQQMQEDKELRKIVEQYVSDIEDTEYADEMGLEDFDYDDFLDELSDLEDEIEDEIFIGHYDWMAGKYVEDEYEYTLFVNNKGEIVGCELEYESDYDAYYDFDYKSYKVVKGSKVAYKLDCGEIVISAEGKESGNKFTGVADIEFDGIDIASVEVTKFDIDGFNKGKLSGKFVIIPDDSLFKYSPLASSYKDMILVVDCNANLKSGKITVELDDDEEMVAVLKYSYNLSKGTKIKLPDSKNTIDMEDDGSDEELYESLDLDLLVEALEKAGAPDDVVEDVEDIDDYDDFLDYLDSVFYPYY